MNFLSNILREEGGFEYKKAIVDSIVILIRDIPDAKESGLLHLCEFIEDCEFTYLSTQVGLLSILTFMNYFFGLDVSTWGERIFLSENISLSMVYLLVFL